MASVNEAILEPALRELGVLAEGEAATAGQSKDALAGLNNLLDQYALERLAMYIITRTLQAITANDGTYTIGASGDIVIARPVYLDRVTVIDTAQDPDLEVPLAKLTEREYQDVSQKARTAGRPAAFYYNPTFPNGTLNLLPVPTDSDLSMGIYAWTPVAEFATAEETISLPPGYRRMLVKNLAVELGPQFSRQIGRDLTMQAVDSKAAVRHANVRFVRTRFSADVPGVGGSGYDIKAG
jgi:hypothetical protein